MKSKAACHFILNQLLSTKNKQLAWIFYEPIDATYLGLHDYYDIVKEPMDLTTVKYRLDSHYYKNASEFAKDVRSIFFNTYLYTTPGHLCYEMAKTLQIIFEKLYEEHLWNTDSDMDHVSISTSDSSLVSTSMSDDDISDITPVNSERNLKTLCDVYPMLRHQEQAQDPTIDHDEGEPFTCEDDVELHTMLQQLSGEIFLQVYHKIRRMEGIMYTKEMDLNVGKLKTSTKRTIQAHLQSKGITGKRKRRLKNIKNIIY